MKYNLINRLPQPINLIIGHSTFVLKTGENKIVDSLTGQMKTLGKKGFIRICKVKNKK